MFYYRQISLTISFSLAFHFSSFPLVFLVSSFHANEVNFFLHKIKTQILKKIVQYSTERFRISLNTTVGFRRVSIRNQI